MTIKMIICTANEDSNYAIGKDNKLMWNCPEDLQYFKKQTVGECVVMGRKTWDSIGLPNGLPSRKNIIISSKKQMSFMSVGAPLWVTSYDRSINFIKSTTHYRDLWVVGGSSIYSQMLPYVNEIHHTTIEGDYPDADTHFDMSFLNGGEWKLYSTERLCKEATVNVWKRV